MSPSEIAHLRRRDPSTMTRLLVKNQDLLSLQHIQPLRLSQSPHSHHTVTTQSPHSHHNSHHMVNPDEYCDS